MTWFPLLYFGQQISSFNSNHGTSWLLIKSKCNLPPPPLLFPTKKKKICRIMLTIGAYMRVKTPFLSSFIFTSLSPHTMCSRYLVDQNGQNIYKFMKSKEKSYAHVKSSFRDLRFEFKGLQWVQSENRSWRSGKENYFLHLNIYQFSISSSVAVEAIMNACNALCFLSMMKVSSKGNAIRTKQSQVLATRILLTN